MGRGAALAAGATDWPRVGLEFPPPGEAPGRRSRDPVASFQWVSGDPSVRDLFLTQVRCKAG